MQLNSFIILKIFYIYGIIVSVVILKVGILMSKIVFKANSKENKETEKKEEKVSEAEPLTESVPKKTKSSKKAAPAPEEEAAASLAESVIEEPSAPIAGDDVFDKEKIVKYFKKHPKKTIKIGRAHV